jgi:hypothetical protein
MASSSLANQLGKNRNVQNSTPPCGNIRVPIQVGIVAKLGERVKKEIKNKEGFLMQHFKSWKDINIILFIS